MAENLILRRVFNRRETFMQVPDQTRELLVSQRELGSSEYRPHLGEDIVVSDECDGVYTSQLKESGLIAFEEKAADNDVSVNEGL